MNAAEPEGQTEREPRFTAGLVAFVLVVGLTAVAVFSGLLPDWGAGVALLITAATGVLLGRRRAGPAPAPAPPGESSQPVVAENVLASLPDPVVLVDAAGIVREANAAAVEWLPALAAGRPLSFALRSPDVLDGMAEVIASGKARDVQYTERVPTERLFEMRILAIPHGDGPGHDALLVVHDLTAARRLEQMRVDFVANASHELRTPLASVLGFIETLQGPAREDPAAREHFLEIMRGQAERMRRLVDDLLSLSRIEQREHLTPTSPVDLRALVQDSLVPLRRLASKAEVEIRFSAPTGPLTVLGDRDELIRLIENLVENAVKYGGGGKFVDVTLAAGLSVELTVRDYGPGIAEEDRPRLTERFYRVNAGESREKGGTGLGLAIVKHIVNRHRGSLTIESELGKGAAVRVQLPAAPLSQTPSENDGQSITPRDGRD